MIRQSKTIIIAGVFVVCGLAADSAFGQVQTIGGSGGGGGGATGGGATGGGGTTQRATGGGASTGGVGGAGFSPSSGFGTGGFGGSSFGTTQGAGGNGGFVGRNDNAGRFVGNTQAGQQGFAGQQPNFGGRGQGGGGFNQTQQSTRNVRVLRPQLRVAFSHPTLKADVVTSAVRVRLQSSQAVRRFPGVEATVDDAYQVTLTGTVESDEQRRLVAILAGFEPGVRSVKNELQVAESKPAENPTVPQP